MIGFKVVQIRETMSSKVLDQWLEPIKGTWVQDKVLMVQKEETIIPKVSLKETAQVKIRSKLVVAIKWCHKIQTFIEMIMVIEWKSSCSKEMKDNQQVNRITIHRRLTVRSGRYLRNRVTWCPKLKETDHLWHRWGWIMLLIMVMDKARILSTICGRKTQRLQY